MLTARILTSVPALVLFQADLKKDAAPLDDSDLEKKRRETDALLQSMGITSADAPVGTEPSTSSIRLFNKSLYISFFTSIESL